MQRIALFSLGTMASHSVTRYMPQLGVLRHALYLTEYFFWHRQRILAARKPSVAEVQQALKSEFGNDELIAKYLQRLAQKLKA